MAQCRIVLKIYKQSIHTGNVILGVAALLSNTESDVDQTLLLPQRPCWEKGVTKGPEPAGKGPGPNLWPLPSRGCCTPSLALGIWCGRVREQGWESQFAERDPGCFLYLAKPPTAPQGRNKLEILIKKQKAGFHARLIL